MGREGGSQGKGHTERETPMERVSQLIDHTRTPSQGIDLPEWFKRPLAGTHAARTLRERCVRTACALLAHCTCTARMYTNPAHATSRRRHRCQ